MGDMFWFGFDQFSEGVGSDDPYGIAVFQFLTKIMVGASRFGRQVPQKGAQYK